MANKLSLEEVKVQFPGAWEEEIDGLDEDEVADLHTSLQEGEGEYWAHGGKLYSRSWWTAFGWHYGEWTGTGWKCPDSGETICPWTGRDE